MKNGKSFNFRLIFNLRSLIYFVITLAILSAVFVIVYFSQNRSFKGLCDGSFVSGALGIGIGGLSFITNQGTFDVFPVGTQNLIAVLRKDGKKRYDGLFEYRNLKAEKRKANRFNPLIYIAAGLIYIVVSIISISIFYSQH